MLLKYQLENNTICAFLRSIENYLKQGITQDEAAYKLSTYERQRKTQINIVLDQLSMQQAVGSRGKLMSALSNLAMPHEDRVIRTAIKVHGKHEMILSGSLHGSGEKKNMMMTAPGGYRSGFNTRPNFYETSMSSNMPLNDPGTLLDRQNRNR